MDDDDDKVSSKPGNNNNNNNSNNNMNSKVSAEIYPISQYLASILNCCLSSVNNDHPSLTDSNTTTTSVGEKSVTTPDQNNVNIDKDTTSSSGNGIQPSNDLLIRNASNKSQVDFHFERESIERALELILRNSFVAIDDMFFSTPPNQRKKTTFQHRLCIRISTCAIKKTITITDLGCGMTRSDLINSLGVGRRLSSRALHAAKLITSAVVLPFSEDVLKLNQRNSNGTNPSFTKSTNDSDYDNHDDASSDDDDDDDDSSVETSSSMSTTEEDNKSEDCKDQKQLHSKDYFSNDARGTKQVVVPCLADDIGSFYAALCSLGTSIQIGTKSKFDDYYEFKLEPSPTPIKLDCTDNEIKDYSHFSITRPMSEGNKLTVQNGFDQFSDLRGDSGTRITIALNQQAIDAGILEEELYLKPIVEKILESSPYSAILEGCCTDMEKSDIIDASRKEEEDILAAMDCEDDEEGFEDDVNLTDTEGNNSDSGSHNSVKERSKYIPLRLSMNERKCLRLVESAMTCCDYTSEVDKPFTKALRRTHVQLKGITSVLRGMVTALDYSAGQKLLDVENYTDHRYTKFFCQMFEIARRHKIMNPEKMRTEYGKLIYLLQDTVSPSVQPHLGFSCKSRIETVYKFLEERNGLALLEDKFIDIATREVLAGKKTRSQISNEIHRKEKAVAILKQNYRSSRLSSEDIHLCLYSICDNDSFLNSNRVPIDKVIGYLKEFFSPHKYEEGYSLSIVSGQDGSRLSHSHERQYYFALQSLTLWRDIIDDMFRLWAMAEEDLLSESVSYSLKDTGQGMQRVQQSPLTYKSMQQILTRVQGKVNKWIGSNVIHLGDHNVPNALTFIDKYTQVPRILAPIVSCIENLERICEKDDGINKFIEEGFGGVERLKKDIMYDFFKSAFDGSGADNFYDAGSCIDGRLTSAWNWCSQLPEKPFFCIFKLTGFIGFDGEFK